MTDELAAIHTQIAHLDDRLTRRDEELHGRLERIESALLGDSDVGLRGMVSRVNRLDELADGIETEHGRIDERRAEADARIHKRLDELEGKWRMAVGIAIGASIGSAGGAVGLMQFFN